MMKKNKFGNFQTKIAKIAKFSARQNLYE